MREDHLFEIQEPGSSFICTPEYTLWLSKSMHTRRSDSAVWVDLYLYGCFRWSSLEAEIETRI